MKGIPHPRLRGIRNDKILYYAVADLNGFIYRGQTRYNNIAILYKDQRKYKDALSYFKKALVIYEKLFGLNHAYILKWGNEREAAVYCNLAGNLLHDSSKPLNINSFRHI